LCPGLQYSISLQRAAGGRIAEPARKCSGRTIPNSDGHRVGAGALLEVEYAEATRARPLRPPDPRIGATMYWNGLPEEVRHQAMVRPADPRSCRPHSLLCSVSSRALAPPPPSPPRTC
jgi:hypothetical protein